MLFYVMLYYPTSHKSDNGADISVLAYMRISVSNAYTKHVCGSARRCAHACVTAWLRLRSHVLMCKSRCVYTNMFQNAAGIRVPWHICSALSPFRKGGFRKRGIHITHK